jgi:hypothetical protein
MGKESDGTTETVPIFSSAHAIAGTNIIAKSSRAVFSSSSASPPLFLLISNGVWPFNATDDIHGAPPCQGSIDSERTSIIGVAP